MYTPTDYDLDGMGGGGGVVYVRCGVYWGNAVGLEVRAAVHTAYVCTKPKG